MSKKKKAISKVSDANTRLKTAKLLLEIILLAINILKSCGD